MKKKEFEFKLRLVCNKQDFEANRQLMKLIPKKNRWDYLDCVTKGYGMQNAYQALPQVMELSKQLDITPSEVLEVYNQFVSLGEILNTPSGRQRIIPTNGSPITKTAAQPLMSKSMIKN